MNVLGMRVCLEGFMFHGAVCAGIAVILLASPVAAGAQVEARIRLDDAGPGPLLTRQTLLKESLDRLARGSALWRTAIDVVGRQGRRVILLTPGEVEVTGPARGASVLEPGVLAEVLPVTRGGSRVDTVVVVIDLQLIESAHAGRRSLPGELQADIDRILAHEVYGHALPYLLAGDLSGRCPDPEPGQPAAEACAIERENAVRAELRLGRRTDAGLGGLLLAWRGR